MQNSKNGIKLIWLLQFGKYMDRGYMWRLAKCNCKWLIH